MSRWAPYGFRFGPAGRWLCDAREQTTLARNARPFAPITLSRLVTNRTVSDNAAALGYGMTGAVSFTFDWVAAG